MYKLEFTLRQHTPLIHFQWEQAGATIRPPELKSKLDKWILQRKTNCYGLSDELLKIAKMDETITPWIKGTRKKDHPALDYKVTINSYGENSFINEINPSPTTNRNGHPVLNNNDYPQYFGNQMKYTGNINDQREEFLTGKKKVKRFSYYPIVEIILNSVHESLLKCIEEEFPLFLLHTNFGTRQSKGFGCFYLDKSDKIFPNEKDGKTDEDFFMKSFDYCFDIKAEGNNDHEIVKDLFTQIDLFYKTIRSGISPNDKFSMYFKSLMWLYAKSMDLQWEKKSIKQEYFSTYEADQKSNHLENNTPLQWKSKKMVEMPPATPETKAKETNLLWRDLLGLSSEQQWGSYSANIKKTSINKDPSTRFKSPLLFKPLRTGLHSYRVFFEIPNYIKDAFLTGDRDVSEAKILGEWFSIIKDGNNRLELPYPDSFDFDKFFKVAFSTNPNSYVKNGDQIIKPDGTPQRKKHGKIISEKNENGKWIDKQNPSFYRLQSIFSQLAYQVEQKNK